MAAFQALTGFENPCANKRAFTLIEILVVCLLVSIILMVGIPVFKDISSTSQLKATSRKIIGTVQGLREEAVRNRKAFTLFIDLDRKRVWYEQNDGKKIQQKKQAEEDVIELPSSVQILDVWSKSLGRKSRGTIKLWISPQGYMDKTIFHLTDGGETVSLLVAPFLGSVSVVDGYAESK